VTHRNQTLHEGEKIAQAVFVKVETDVLLVEADNIYDEDTSRGEGALGSTGDR
jgi:dUTPase